MRFIAGRNDAGGDHRKICFDEEQLAGYVPIRRPTTLCVQERLPAGAAGVLLNQSHQFRDLLLVIGEQEKRMFEAIDGHRTVKEIIDLAGEEEMSRARAFFEKLWRYDQIVFKTFENTEKN